MSVVESFYFNLPEDVELSAICKMIGSEFTEHIQHSGTWNGTHLGTPITLCDNHGSINDQGINFESYRYCVYLTSFSPHNLLIIQRAAVAHIAYSICSVYNGSGILVHESQFQIGKMQGRDHIVYDVEAGEPIGTGYHFEAYYCDSQ
ncbi:MAG: hypothetical protein AAF664_21200 [Planctomycetota bacterium]